MLVTTGSDLYSVGVVMFRALTGKLPIADGETDVAKIVNAVRFKPAEDVRDLARAGTISESVAALISQVLAKDLFDRHETGKYTSDLPLLVICGPFFDRLLAITAVAMEATLKEALLQSPGASYDIFISYRVKTEGAFAKSLHEKLSKKVVGLNGERARVYLDAVELRDGADWEAGFVAGLTRSSVFVPLLSLGSTEPLTELLEIEVRIYEVLGRASVLFRRSIRR